MSNEYNCLVSSSIQQSQLIQQHSFVCRSHNEAIACTVRAHTTYASNGTWFRTGIYLIDARDEQERLKMEFTLVHINVHIWNAALLVYTCSIASICI